MPDVTLLIVNWNTCDRLIRCLQSLQALPDVTSREVVVVDNGSTDGSVERVLAEHPEVRLLRNERNEGFAHAVNWGIAETASPFVLLLNSDAELQAGALDTLVSCLRGAPDVAAAGAQLYTPSGRRQHSFDLFPSLLTELGGKSILRRLAPSLYPSRLQAFDSPQEVDSLIGACMMLRRDAIDSVGPLDERFFVFYEETDWCFRARRDGWRILLVPAARAFHAQGETKSHHPGRARVESWRSKYAYFDKHRGRIVRAFLQLVSFARLSAQLLARVLACVATLGLVPSIRSRMVADAWLWCWHLMGCPRGMGFAPSESIPGYVRTIEEDGRRWLPAADALKVRGTALYRIGAFLGSEAARLIKEGRTKRHWRVTLAAEGSHREWVVKEYKAGGFCSRLKEAVRGSRAHRELARMVFAAQRGIPVSLPALVAEWNGGGGALVFSPLDGWRSLDAWLRGAGNTTERAPAGRRRADVIRAAGRFARRVYEAGVDQDDFNPTNVFVRVDPGGSIRLLLVDFERVRMRPVVPWRRRLRTLAKMTRQPAWASRSDRIRFLRAMMPACASRDELRRMLRSLGKEVSTVQARDMRRADRRTGMAGR